MSTTFVIALSPIAIAINQSLFVGELIKKLYNPNCDIEKEGDHTHNSDDKKDLKHSEGKGIQFTTIDMFSGY